MKGERDEYPSQDVEELRSKLAAMLVEMNRSFIIICTDRGNETYAGFHFDSEVDFRAIRDRAGEVFVDIFGDGEDEITLGDEDEDGEVDSG